jgi:hypothetical protein
LAAVGTFRIVPEQDLDIGHDTLGHLRADGLVEAVDLGGDERGLVLTKQGRDLLESHTLERDNDASQAFYAGVSRSREIDHDSNLYATYRQEEARLRDEHGGLDIRRVILEQDLKREYQEFLQEHNRGRADSDGRPDRDEGEIREWAREHDLPYFDEQVHFPDYRITRDRVIKAVRGAQRVAGIEQGVHILRHTFCSHLAMKGVPARAIQELAGHADLSTTQRYMHLSPAATEDAIRLLDGRQSGLEPADQIGDILDTGGGVVERWSAFRLRGCAATADKSRDRRSTEVAKRRESARGSERNGATGEAGASAASLSEAPEGTRGEAAAPSAKNE